jgi:hypothetical protein
MERPHTGRPGVRQDRLEEDEQGEHQAEQRLAAPEPADESGDEDEERDDEEYVPEHPVRLEDVVEARAGRAVLHAEDPEAGQEELDDDAEGEDGEKDAVDCAH